MGSIGESSAALEDFAKKLEASMKAPEKFNVRHLRKKLLVLKTELTF
jgi:hypothetical protein